MSLTVALKAMRDDAAMWKDVAETLADAASSADRLTLTEQDLSFASVGTGVIDSYLAIQAKAARLLREGDGELGRLSDRLYEIADAYERNDEQAAKRFHNVWEPRR